MASIADASAVTSPPRPPIPSDDATEHELLRRVLALFAETDHPRAAWAPLGRGLINRTYLVTVPGDDVTPARYVLQRVSPIFDPAIHDNIRAVTGRLAAAGIETPRLLDTRAGAPCALLGSDGTWRVMTFVDGVTFDVIDSPDQARAAAHLVGRFHAALDAFAHRFAGMRLGVHDTARHLAVLRQAIDEHASHRLHPVVRPLGEAILAAAAALPPLPALAPRVCHGDLKFNNVLFAGPSGADRRRPRCLVDLDTVGPMSLAYELGDAWRSWCNPHGEDREDGRFDLDVFAASLDGWREGLGRDLAGDERTALLGGPEWVSLELSARFAADALNERYFGWDRTRYPAAGEHNLVRARSQWSLHHAVVATRAARAALLGIAPTD